MLSLFKKILGSKNDRELKRLGKVVKQINELEAEIKQEVDTAVKEFESRSDFKPDAPFDHVFGTAAPDR